MELFSSQAANSDTRRTATTPPRPGAKAMPSAEIDARDGWLMTAASTPPSMGEPPKVFTALMPTNIFRPKKAALPATASICAIGDAAHDGSIFKATFSSPVMRPQAMKAGMMGTKMAEIFFKASLAGVAFFFVWRRGALSRRRPTRPGQGRKSCRRRTWASRCLFPEGL